MLFVYDHNLDFFFSFINRMLSSWVCDSTSVLYHLVFVEKVCFKCLFQENYFWLDRILRSYQSRVYSGDLAASFEVCAAFACL